MVECRAETAARTSNRDVASIGETRTAELAEQLVVEYRSCNAENHDRLARSFEGMAEVVTELRRRQFLTGLVTSKSRVFALRGLKLCGLSELMDAAIFMEDTELHKPNPEPLLLGLERLKVLAEQAAYVGDSRHDMQAGRAARVRTVAALWGPVPEEELKKEQPDFLVPAASNLLEIFQ